MQYKNHHQTFTAYKVFFIAAALLGSAFIAKAQTNIAVAPNKMNVLYIGIDNPLSVAASGGTDDKVTVSVTGGGGTITKTGTGFYNVRVTSVTDECLVNVYVNGSLAGTSHFRVRATPDPSATLGSYASGEKIAADVFRRMTGIGVWIKDFPFEIRFEVVGFTFTIDGDNGEVKTADCEGAAFSEQARQYMDKYLQPGRTVTIDKIRVKDPSGRERKVPSLVYYIK